MARYPNFPGIYEPNIPGQAHARHDPRAFAQRHSPAFQGDQLAMHDARRGVGGGLIPFEDAVAYATARGIPPQLAQGGFLTYITAFGATGAKLCIPKNPWRWSFLVSNFTLANLILFSFDKPIDSGQNIGAGIPMGTYYQEANGSVSINDIWVFCNDSSVTFPVPILGYQGQVSVTGNPRVGP